MSGAEFSRRLLDVTVPCGGWVIVLYEIYIDESGTHGTDDIVVVGGYALPSERAKRMQRQWTSRNNRFGVPIFHMVDCAHGNGAYKGIPKLKRAKLVEDLIALVKKHTTIGFACALPPNGRLVQHSDDAYSDALMRCIILLRNQLKELVQGQPKLSILIEDGHSSKGVATKTIERLMSKPSTSGTDITGFGFFKKKDLPLLQSADLLVWQQAKFLKDKSSCARKPRRDYQSLIEHPHYFLYNLISKESDLIYFDRSWVRDDQMLDEAISDFFGTSEPKSAWMKSHLSDPGGTN